MSYIDEYRGNPFTKSIQMQEKKHLALLFDISFSITIEYRSHFDEFETFTEIYS